MMVSAMALMSQRGLTTSGWAVIGGVRWLSFGVGRGMSRASVSTLAFGVTWLSRFGECEPSKMGIVEDFEWRSG